MPLSPDPKQAKLFIDRIGIDFAMFDGETSVPCRVTWQALRDAGSRSEEQSDIEITFAHCRGRIEQVASDHYDTGEMQPIVMSRQFLA